MKVLIIDDSAFMRRALSQMIASDSSLQVVDTAINGQDGIEKARRHKPDVITLDVEMPVMDGLTALKKMQAELADPKPAILMCSSLTSAGSHEALAALRLGAADVIAKPGSQFSLSINEIQADLIAKIKAVGQARGRKRLAIATGVAASTAAAAQQAMSKLPRLKGKDLDAVLIGSSTGGPPALEMVLTALPADLPVPVVIAQHMPAMFTKSLAERLDEMCAVSVVHADAGMPLHPGTVYVIVGGKHGRVIKSGLGKFALEISGEPATALYKPCVNELLASGARVMGRRALGVVLTGMGDDGAEGAGELAKAGGSVIAQDMESCVVYGMPKAVAERGHAAASLPPKQIGTWIAGLARGEGTGGGTVSGGAGTPTNGGPETRPSVVTKVA